MLQSTFLRRCRRGHSIPEMLICTVLLSALLASLYTVLHPGLRIFAHSNVDAEVQQEAVKAMQMLCSELGNSVREQVDTGSSPQPYVWFLSHRAPMPNQDNPEEFSPSGQLVWKKWVFYTVNSGVLTRSELALDTPVDVVVPAPAPTPGFVELSTNGVGRRNVARHLTSFEADPVGTNMVRIRLQAARDVASDKNTSIQLETQVYVRNQ